MKHSLRPEREGGAGDGRGQLEALDDLLPQLLVDDVDEAAARHHQVVQLVQVQDLLGHDGQAVDGRPCGGDGRLGLLREASHGRPRSGGAVHVLRDHPHPPGSSFPPSLLPPPLSSLPPSLSRMPSPLPPPISPPPLSLRDRTRQRRQ